MENKLEKQIRLLKTYALLLTLLCGTFMVTGFVAQSKNQKFEEIDVERINIVEKDGRLKLVISNAARQHPGSVDGKLIPRAQGRDAGLIMFNDRGDEVGGLVFSGDTDKDRYGSLTFDKFRGDQTIAFQHLESRDGSYFSGLTFNDENNTTTDRLAKMESIKRLPDEAARRAAQLEMKNKGEFLVPRLQLGRGRSKSSFISLSDANGRERIQISVAADGTPKIQFLDDKGQVVYSLPGKPAAEKQ